MRKIRKVTVFITFIIPFLVKSFGTSTEFRRFLEVDENFASVNPEYDSHKILSIGTSSDHTCILDIDRDIYCFGKNTWGYLGYGDTVMREQAQNSEKVDIGNRVAKKVFAAASKSCALLETDDLICWGAVGALAGLYTPNSAALGDGPNEMGDNLPIINFGPGRKVKKVTMGFSHGCVILDNDRVKCFGSNSRGQAGVESISTINSNIAGDSFYVDLNATSVYEISAGMFHTCAVTDIGLKCFGNNEYGELGYGDTINRGYNPNTMGVNLPDYNFTETVENVFVMDYTTCAIFTHGRAKCWGRNNKGQLGYGHKQNQGNKPDSLPHTLPYIDVGSGNSITQIQGSSTFNCALLSNQTVKCWGGNSGCILGPSTSLTELITMGNSLPIVALGSRKVVEMFGGCQGAHVCVIFTDRSSTCWGSNGYGQLGQLDKSIGCEENEMGDNLENVCAKDNVKLDITTDSNPKSTSWQLMHFTKNILVMQTRAGYYTLPFYTYKHRFCVPKGDYGFSIEYTLGEFDGAYEISVNNDGFRYKNAKGFSFNDEKDFSLCHVTSECRKSDHHCRKSICNKGACSTKNVFKKGCTVGDPKTLILRCLSADSTSTPSSSDLASTYFGIQSRLRPRTPRTAASTNGDGGLVRPQRTRIPIVSNIFNTKSQLSSCSYNQLNISPFSNTGVTNGVADITISEGSKGKAASYVANKFIEAANSLFGDLSKKVDLLIICLPLGTTVGSSTSWRAYAYVNSYISIYNGLNCKYPSVQMHEIGHNLGLSHSNDEENYGDISGMMGKSFAKTDGPVKCFNAPKSWRLEWYEDGYLSADVNEIIDKQIELVGISDYGSIQKRATHLKIINTENGYDYFIAFNRKKGINIGTNEGENNVLVTKRRVGQYYDDSFLVATLSHLQKFSLYGVGSQGAKTLQITPNIYLDTVPGFARVSFEILDSLCNSNELCNDNNLCTIDKCTVVNGSEICTNEAKDCSDCGASLLLELKTNDYPSELLWDIKNIETNRVVQSSVYYSEEYTSYVFSDCLEYGKYLFTIFYANSTVVYENNATFILMIGEEVLVNGNITEVLHVNKAFSICEHDSQCHDYNGCTVDVCDIDTKLCNNDFIPEDEECSSCHWLSLEIAFDNFAEETSWNIKDTNFSTFVEYGDPYSIHLSTLGDATTSSGRRKAPTKSGRRKAPTKAGRRKAPTRATPFSSHRYLVEDDNVSEKICLEWDIKYLFTITDSFGDGICCTEGDGFFNLTIQSKEIKSGSDFGKEEQLMFKISLEEEGCEDNDPSYIYEYQQDIQTCVYYPVTCEGYGEVVNVIVRTDIYASDSIWRVYDNISTRMEEGTYVLAYTRYESEKCLPYGLYRFHILDRSGDGMAFCFDKDCGYQVIVNNQTLIESDGSFSLEKTHVFGICTSDEQCDDFDDCTEDSCDVTHNVCIFTPLLCSICGMETIVIDVTTDILFSLTSWELIKIGSNVTVSSAGPFVQSFTNYRKTVCGSLGRYLFRIRNSEGRGMTICNNLANCGYSIMVNNERILESDGSFKYENNHHFVICDHDEDCNDGDYCTLSRCDTTSKTCRKDYSSCSVCEKKDFQVVINTDGNATETSWTLLSLVDQETLAVGGVYAKNYSKYQFKECIPYGNYIFTIFDSGGNGLTTCHRSNSSCGYMLIVENKTILESYGDFSYEQSHNVFICGDGSNCSKSNSTFIPTPTPSILSTTDQNHVFMKYSQIKSFSVGYHHTCAITYYAQVFCWGSNRYGQLGYGDEINRDRLGQNLPPIDIGKSNKAREIFSGAFHNCILLEDADIICFGDNSYGQLGVGSTTNIGSTSEQMGDALIKVYLGEGRKIKKVSLGYQHSCALLDNNSIKCWGGNKYGELGYGHTDTIGDDESEMQKLEVINLGDEGLVEDVSAGTYHTCVLHAGEAKCFGINRQGQLGYGDTINRGAEPNTIGNNLPAINISGIPAKIIAGNSMTCVIFLDARAKCFGYNEFGQLGYGDKLHRGGNAHELGDALPFIDIGDHENLIHLTKGSYSTCSLTEEGNVKCLGWNLECSLGLGDKMDRSTNTEIGNHLPYIDFGGRKVKMVKMIHFHACALFLDGTLSCWGFNRYGQLGRGNYENVGCTPDQMGDQLVLAEVFEAEDWYFRFDEMYSESDYDIFYLSYSLSKDVRPEQFVTSIQDSFCSVNVNDTFIALNTSIEHNTNNIFSNGIVQIQMNYSRARNSDLWIVTSQNSGYANFCVRTDLLLGNGSDISVSYIETMIQVYLNFNTRFSNFAVSDITLKKSYASDVIKDELVEIEACICNLSLECIESPNLMPNAYFSFCVIPNKPSIQVKKFISVSFYQDGILKFSPVVNSDDMQLTTTYVGKIGMLRTHLFSSFFEARAPSDLYISGKLLLEFEDRRSLKEIDQGAAKKIRSITSSFYFRIVLMKQTSVFYLSFLGFISIVMVVFLTSSCRQKRRIKYIPLPTEE